MSKSSKVFTEAFNFVLPICFDHGGEIIIELFDNYRLHCKRICLFSVWQKLGRAIHRKC